MDPMQEFLGKMIVWNSLRTETLQYSGQLDDWMRFCLILLLVLIGASWLDKAVDQRFGAAIVAAVILGAVSSSWIGRLDVLIHRPAPGVRAIEDSFGQVSGNASEPVFRGWENYYKLNLKRGVKILAPLDLLAGLFVFALFMYANNGAYHDRLKDWPWRNYFWWTALAVHLCGWGVIASARWLAG